MFLKNICLFLILQMWFLEGWTQNGQIWGVSSVDGTNNIGAIFRMNGDGNNFAVQKSFHSSSEGFNPESALTLSQSGKIYGVTRFGGSKNYGVIFEFDPILKSYQKKLDFIGENGRNPRGTLLEAANGKIYGLAVAEGGYEFVGPYEIFEFDPISNAIEVKYKSLESGSPFGSLIQASNNKIYGCSGKELVEFNPSTGQIKSIPLISSTPFEFDGPTSLFKGIPSQGTTLIEASDAKLYGISTTGKLFRYDINSGFIEELIRYFPTGSSRSIGGLIELEAGKLWWSDLNKILEFTISTQTVADKAEFPGSDIVDFYGSLLTAPNGKLYGFTYNGGSSKIGSIYEFDPVSNVIIEKFAFTQTNGAYPTYGSMILTTNGKLLGTTGKGGKYNSGVIYEFDYITSQFTKLYDFVPALEGANPIQITLLPSDKFIGTTNLGGIHNAGVLFEYNPVDGMYKKLHDFGPDSGVNPIYGPCLAANGKMYGLTSRGGVSDGGVLYEFELQNNTLKKKQDVFAALNGKFSMYGMIPSENGNLYGTVNGGINDNGVLFEYNPSLNELKSKVNFEQGFLNPNGVLTIDDGAIFGTTFQGGIQGTGSIFKYDPKSGTLINIVEFPFNHGPPVSGVTKALNSKFYGSTGFGEIFQFDPVSNNLEFKTNVIPNEYFGPLLNAPNGKLYGIGFNSLVEFNPIDNSLTKKRTGKFAEYFVYSGLLFRKESQNISFNSLPAKTFGDGSFNLEATTSSGLPITFTSSDPTVASIAGATVTILKSGTVTITAYQEGDAVFKAASPIQQNLLVNKATPLIQWNNPSGIVYGTLLSALQLNAIASADGAFNYEPGLGTKLSAGNEQSLAVKFTPFDLDNYSTADKIVKINVSKAQQTIEFKAPSDKTIGDPGFTLSASVDSGLPIHFESTSDNIKITENEVDLIKPGKASVTAKQIGNENYLPTSNNKTFCIKPFKPVVSLTKSIPDKPILLSSSVVGNQWFLNDLVITGANQPTYTASTEGVYKVQVTIDECLSEFSNSLPLVITSLNESNSDEINLHPNPASESILLTFGTNNHPKEIIVFDAIGKQMERKRTNESEIQISLIDFPKGLYFVRVQFESFYKVSRFIKH